MEAYYVTFHFHDLGSPNMLPAMTNYLKLILQYPFGPAL
jgi:hypothetical protein